MTLMQILQRQYARFMHLNVLTFFTLRDIIRSQVKIHVFGFVPLKISNINNFKHVSRTHRGLMCFFVKKFRFFSKKR